MSDLTNYCKDISEWRHIYYCTFDLPDSDVESVTDQLGEWFSDGEMREAWGKQEEALDGQMVDDLVFRTGAELNEARAVAHEAIKEWFISDDMNQYAAWMYLCRKSKRDSEEHRAESLA